MKKTKSEAQTSKYNSSEIEQKWQKIWEEKGIYRPDLGKAEKPFYNLMMFPYPSAEGMHVGNMYAFTGADVYGRYMRMRGFNVFEPIGLDGFGIHSENYALKTGRHPKEQAKLSEANFYRQLHATGNGFDWSRTVETYAPSYYKWTQWLFIQLFKTGLAYRKKAPVNFCPSCKTVLADEQVIDARPPASSPAGEVGWGKCERCGTVVEKRDLEQWFFKITKYADRLLYGLNKIDWVEKVKIAQREWIGRSEGAQIEFRVQSSEFRVQVFTTRPDTLFGATFLVLSPEHPFVASLLNSKFKIQNSKLEEVEDYVEKTKKKSAQERIAADKEKTGVFTGLYAINPLNGEKIPVWIADYALMDYGTGALFGDAHDDRDVKFAKKYGIPLKPTIITGNKEKDEKILSLEECFTGYGTLIDSGPFSGLASQQAIKKVIEWLSKNGSGEVKTTYHLRDWLISRQRYWGPPIPMINCPKCGWQPVPEKDLPVLLPDVSDWKPLGTGKSPLANHPEFYKTKCPKCGGEAKRETDVSDTFLDSAWYFLRYTSTDIENRAFDTERTRKWLPVNMYIGGAEHSVLHLLYARFITMVLHDLRLIDFDEPFSRFYAHGLLIKEGAKMSKSKGNVVVPDEYIRKFGADTVRVYLMFTGPFDMGGDFRDSGIEGMYKFLKRVWTLVIGQLGDWEIGSKPNNLKTQNPNNLQEMHKTIKGVTDDLKNLRYNTAIAKLMAYYNFLASQESVSREEIKTLLLLLAPFAPHMTEELYQFFRTQNSKLKTQNPSSIHLHPLPSYDSKFLEEDEVTIVVQVNGKMRDLIKIKNGKLKVKNEIEDLAKESKRVLNYISGKKIKKVIYVQGEIINFVISD